MRRPTPLLRALAPALAVALVSPAAALAADPVAKTGGVKRITFSSARLTGTVNAGGRPTTYFFQYGTTKAYGAQTPAGSAGSSTSALRVGGDVVGLAPNTRYHVRLVARSDAGVSRGQDVAFTTRRQPLGLTLAAAPNPVQYGGGTTLAGTLSGTGNAGQAVQLRQNPFPFTAGLQPFGNQVLTDSTGAFSVTVASVPLTTQYQAVLAERPSVQSPIVTVPVAVRVSTSVNHRRVRRGRRVHFSGSIRPARDGAQVAVQKRAHGRWVTIAGTITRHRSRTRSVYGKSVRVPRGGRYRIFVGLQDGNHTSNVGRTIVIHTHR